MSGKTSTYATVGLVLSMYALYVEHKMAHKPAEEEFSALCDIEAIGASCSSVFRLPEGRMLSYFGLVPKGSIIDVPNAALGFVYYSLWLSLMSKLPKEIKLLISSLAMLSSVLLAVQLVILSELCILCWCTHIINASLWWDAYSSFRARGNAPRGKAKIKRV